MRATVHELGQRSGWRLAAVAAAAVAAGCTLSGCPKNPTVVLTTVNADQTVPALTQLNLLMSSTADPSIHVSSMLVSVLPGSLDGGLLPAIALPAQFPFSVDPSYLSGPVIIRVDGLDNDTGTLLATGSTAAQIIPNQQTEATLTLTAVGRCATGGGDAGQVGDGGNVGAICDGGADGGARDGSAGGG